MWPFPHLVQQQDCRVAHEGSSDRNALLLPTGELAALEPHLRVVPGAERVEIDYMLS